MSEENFLDEWRLWNKINSVINSLKGNASLFEELNKLDKTIISDCYEFYDLTGPDPQSGWFPYSIPIRELKQCNDFSEDQIGKLDLLLKLLSVEKDKYKHMDFVGSYGEGYIKAHDNLEQLMEKIKATNVGKKVLAPVKRPRPSRKQMVLVKFIKDRIRQNKRVKPDELWGELKRFSDEFPLTLKGDDLIYESGKLIVYSRTGKKVTITRKTFGTYFRECKNPPARAK